MSRSRGVVLFALTVLVVSLAAAPAAAVAGAAQPVNSVDSTAMSDESETQAGTETTSPADPTPTPDDGPDGHADDPFPRWLPVAFVGVLVVGIAAVGGGLWVVYARVRRFIGW